MPNPWRGLSGLPPSLWLLFTATLINRAGTMVLPFLALYLTRTQGYEVSQAGALLALYGGVAIVASPLAGRLCDRFGPLPVIVAGLLGNGAALLAFPLARGPWIVLATVALSASTETARPASLAAATAWSSVADRRMAFALLRLAINLGVSVGPALGGFLATRSFRFLFGIDAATSLAAGTVLLATAARLGLTGRVTEALERRDRARTERRLPALEGCLSPKGEFEHRPQPDPAAPTPPVPSPWADGRFLGFLAVNVLVTMIFFQHNSTMPLYLVRTLGLSPALYGLLFTLNTFLIVFLEVPLNAAMADWPFGRALALGALLSGLGFGALALVASAWGVAATVVVWTFGEMILFPTAAACATHFAPPARQGVYMGLYSMSSAVAFALGPWAGTRVLEAWGGQAVWGVSLACGLLAAILFRRMAEVPEAPAPSAAASRPRG